VRSWAKRSDGRIGPTVRDGGDGGEKSIVFSGLTVMAGLSVIAATYDLVLGAPRFALGMLLVAGLAVLGAVNPAIPALMWPVRASGQTLST